MAKFVSHRNNAPRYPEEVWESHKQVLVDKYMTMTIEELMIYMKREHGFSPTKRQLSNRLRETWGVRKYKTSSGPKRPTRDAVSRNPRPPPPAAAHELLAQIAVPKIQLPSALATPAPVAIQGSSSSQLASEDVKTRYLWLADILIAFRDAHHAFDINAALWKARPSSKHTLACISTAQYEPQLIVDAREMARRDAEPFLINGRSQSWAATFLDLLNAHTYDWGTGTNNGLGQIAKIFDDIVEERDFHGHVQDHLVELTPRGPHLDVPAYTLLRPALAWHNSAYPDAPIDAPRVLSQFIAQHLSARRREKQVEATPNLDINCLPLCLHWCRAILGSHPDIPPEFYNADGDIAIETFTVLCVLLRPLLGNGPPSYRAVTRSCTTLSPNWANSTEQELGIRPTQLLCTVACMIMAASIQQNMHAGQSLIERALTYANALNALEPGALLRRFLNQTSADNWRVRGQADAERGFPIWEYGVDARKMEPFRRFAATSLGIYDFPAIEEGVCVFELVALAGPEFPEEGC
ncbi:hypothetical protein B0I37DRAFT_350942 [Chaetomium sp. MPI-CAGE-AT-0009]|nr:hypothetical protein B0I37DRAFT_350942 [Chaetomium sp. MPI-CAGE-AT-0009]